jgi:pimeloyl-ACP methyl ester carboxylesterase
MSDAPTSAADAALRTSSVTVDGVTSPVLEAGPAAATEAVVFVHGNPGVARDWLALLEPAGAFTGAIAITMPGYGDADKPRDFPSNCSASRSPGPSAGTKKARICGPFLVIGETGFEPATARPPARSGGFR